MGLVQGIDCHLFIMIRSGGQHVKFWNDSYRIRNAKQKPLSFYRAPLPLILIPTGGLVVMTLTWLLYGLVYNLLESLFYPDNPLAFPAGAVFPRSRQPSLGHHRDAPVRKDALVSKNCLRSAQIKLACVRHPDAGQIRKRAQKRHLRCPAGW